MAGILPEVYARETRNELERVVKSELFANSIRLQRFLTYVVEEALAGRAGSLKEYSVALNVFDCGAAFDSRTNTIVRVEARRLRSQLEAYYHSAGAGDPVRIELPKGGYAPVFRPNPRVTVKERVPVSAAATIALMMAAIVLAGAGFLVGRGVVPAGRGGPRMRPGKPAAVRWYRDGRYLRQQRTAEALDRSIAAFQNSVDADPQFAPAYGGLAGTYAIVAFHGLASESLTISRATESALKAISLDRAQAEAHGALGWMRCFHDWNWPEAQKEFRAALRDDPADAIVHQWYALALASRGRFEEALSQSQRATDLDPTYAATNDYPVLLYLSRRYTECVEESRRIIRLKPESRHAYAAMGSCYAGSGRHEDAIRSYRAAQGSGDPLLEVSGRLALSYGMTGKKSEALTVLEGLADCCNRGEKRNAELALAYIGLGEKAKAMESLERAVRQHESDVMFMEVEPLLDTIRSEAAFQILLTKVGLTSRHR